MAILDERSELADALALSTASTGRTLLGDVMDLQAGGLAIAPNAGLGGVGEGVYFNIQVDTAVTSGGAATVAFELVSDAQSAIATDGSATVHAATGAIPKAALVAGAVALSIQLPPGKVYERDLGVIQNVGTAALTAGKVNMWIADQPATGTRVYADNVI